MKIERLLAIVVLLLNRRRTTAKELAMHFEVSVRTIYRDIATLNGAGIPVVASQGHEGGLAIPDGYKLSRQLLSARDLEALLATLRGVNQAMVNRDLQRIIDTLDNLLLKDAQTGNATPHQSLLVDITPWGPTSTSEEIIRTLQRAVDNALLLDFSYTNAAGLASRRTVEPHTLVYKSYAWYLIAYCRLRQDFRLFRLSRITKVNLRQEPFLRREVGDPQRFFTFDCAPSQMVVLRFAPRARARVEDTFPGTELISDDSGFLTANLYLPDDPWLFSVLLGFGADLEILSPDDWRQRMKKIADDMKNLYAT